MHGRDDTALETTDESTDVIDDMEPMQTDDINHAEMNQVIFNEATLQEDRISISGMSYALTYYIVYSKSNYILQDRNP